jgi:putative ABC transport system permease protein
MDKIGELWRRLTFPFRRHRFDRDLEEEMRFHLEMRAAESGGAAARRQFGNAALLREDSRAAWGWQWAEDLARDVGYAVRSLRRSPAFAAVAVLTLGLGIGVNTAMFSVLYGTCLAPLPYAEPDRLVDVSMMQTTGRRFDAGTSLPNLRDWTAQARSFEALAAHRLQFFVNLTGHGEAEEVHAWRLSAGLLRTLGVRPVVGRWFVPEEDVASGPRSALIAHSLWQSRFGGDPTVPGKRLFVDGEAYTIAGVMPPEFEFPPLIGTWIPSIWLSLNLPPEMAEQRNGHSLSVAGRLKRGVTVKQAQAEMDAIAARLARAYPKENGEWPAAKVTRLSGHRSVTGFRSTMWLLLGAAGLVLLIACANIASLLLARGAAREREFAVRRALGVSRGRLARQLLTESGVLAGVGCLIGIALAYWSLPVLKLLLEGRPRAGEIGISPAVLAFAAVTAALTAILFGLWPAVRAGRIEPALRDVGRGPSPRQRLGKVLVTAQIAAGLLLVSAAGLLIETYWRATHVDLGFRPERLLTARVNLPKSKYDTGHRVEAFREELLRGVSALPGVQFAGTNSAPPMGVISQGSDFEVEGRQGLPAGKPFAGFANVSPDYLRAMGIPLLRGRHFHASDGPGAAPAAIVSESLARRFFPGEEVLGRRLRLGRVETAGWFTIVGVAGDVRQDRPEGPPESTIYVLSRQLPEAAQGGRAARLIVLVARTAGDPVALARGVRRVVAGIDKNQPVADVMPMREAVGKKLTGRRLNTLLVAAFAALALALASIGVFGLVSYAVARRTQEIGIRMALGAQRSAILWLLVRGLLALGMAGVAAGIAASLGAQRLLESLLDGMKPDPAPILIASIGLLIAATLAAALTAARRATAVDPVITLRHD